MEEAKRRIKIKKLKQYILFDLCDLFDFYHSIIIYYYVIKIKIFFHHFIILIKQFNRNYLHYTIYILQ